jgi:uncharacterized LabA/DUF88 family protein
MFIKGILSPKKDDKNRKITQSNQTPAKKEPIKDASQKTRTQNVAKKIVEVTQLASSQDHPDQRVGIFIDTSNLYHSARALYQSRLNFEAVLKDAVRNRKLIRAFAYVIRTEGGEESKFFIALKDLGFEVREKDLKIFHTGTKKADWDIGIAMDIVRLVAKLDVIILVSGDGDFVELVKYAQAQGVRVELMSFGRSTSAELIEEVDFFIDFDKEPKKYTFLTR